VSTTATTTSGATTPPAPAGDGSSSTTQQALGGQSSGGDAPATAGATGAGANGERAARVRKAAASVTIRNFAFSPATVTVRVGETVTWTNADSVVHNAAGNGFRTPLLERGQSASYTFTRPGTYRYHCDPHPFMRGTVVVVAAQGGGSGSGAAAGGKAGGATGSAGNAGGAGSGGGSGQQGAAANSPSLPATGAAAGLLALLGAGFVAGGALVRRAARRLAEHS
jgi:amicyanin